MQRQSVKAFPHDKVRFEKFINGERVPGSRVYNLTWLYCRLENFVIRASKTICAITGTSTMFLMLFAVAYGFDDEFAEQAHALAKTYTIYGENDRRLQRVMTKVYVKGTTPTGVKTFAQVLRSLDFTVVTKKDDAVYVAHVAKKVRRDSECLGHGNAEVSVYVRIEDRTGRFITDFERTLDPMDMPCEYGAFTRQLTEVIRLSIIGQRDRYKKRLVDEAEYN